MIFGGDGGERGSGKYWGARKKPLAPTGDLGNSPTPAADESLGWVDNGSIAQLVEQWIEDPRVGGSNPSRATIFKPEGRG